MYIQPDVSAVEAGQGSKYSWCCKHKANGRHVHIHTESCEKILYVSKICSEGGESSCNFGDGTDQTVQSLMFMMMMMIILSFI